MLYGEQNKNESHVRKIPILLFLFIYRMIQNQTSDKRRMNDIKIETL